MTNRSHPMLLTCMLALVLTLAACADPTTSEEYIELAADNAALEDEVQDLQSRLNEATAEANAAASMASEQTERADAAEEEVASLQGQHEQLLADIGQMAESVEVARDLVAVEAADALTGDPELVAALPPNLRDLREQLASQVGWFDTAEEYHLFLSSRAFARATSALDASGDVLPALWNSFWNAEVFSEEEENALVEYIFRKRIIEIETLDQALAIANDHS